MSTQVNTDVMKQSGSQTSAQAAAQTSQSVLITAPVWFSTGCSTGFALDITKQCIQRACRAVMTARDPAALEGYGATENVLGWSWT
jgi:hypothetical protein